MPKVAHKLLRPILVLLIVGWFFLSSWLAVPPASMAALGGLGAILLLTAFRPAIASGSLKIPACGWIASLAVFAGLWFEKNASHLPDLAYAWLAWMVALAIFATGLCLDQTPNRRKWLALAMGWAIAGGAIWLTGGYLQNDRLGFNLAIVVMLALLIGCLFIVRPPYAVVLLINSLILLLVLLPLIDFFIRPSYEFKPQTDDARRLYSYEAARKDPEAFGAWWWEYYQQFHSMVQQLGSTGVKQPSLGLYPYSHATFFRSEIRMNNKGLRGPDISDEKGDAYRILAVGESTTFGMTTEPGGKPWPEVLEKLIRERLKPGRPVQVINAGIFAATLPDNLQRLPAQIQALKPDMIISYHGINGFFLLSSAVPPMSGSAPPTYQPRPLKLLANAEYGIRMRVFRNSRVPKTSPASLARVEPLDTSYARCYEQLIGMARTNHIQLVLANFSMAVNEHSDPDVVAFYQAGFPSVSWDVQANKLHTLLIDELAKGHPDVREVDTHAGLDGDHDKFIDLIHFTQDGDDQLAGNMFEGIRDMLEEKLKGK